MSVVIDRLKKAVNYSRTNYNRRAQASQCSPHAVTMPLYEAESLLKVIEIQDKKIATLEEKLSEK